MTVFRCIECGAISGKLEPFHKETLGSCGYRAGWRAQRHGDKYVQFCPRHAPPDPPPPPPIKLSDEDWLE